MSLSRKLRRLFGRESIKKEHSYHIENIQNSTVYQAGGNINTGLVEQLHLALKQFQFGLATGYVDSIRRLLNVSDGFDIQFDIKTPNHFKIVPRISKDNQDGVIRGKATFILPDEFRDCKNVEDMIKRLYFKQKSVRLKVISIQTRIGEQIVTKFGPEIESDQQVMEMDFTTSEGMEVCVGDNVDSVLDREIVISPMPFGKPSLVILETSGNTSSITLELGLVEIDEREKTFRYLLDNGRQGIPIKATFALELPKELHDGEHAPMSIDFSYEMAPNASKYYNVLMAKLLIGMNGGDDFILREQKTGKILCKGGGVKFKNSNMETLQFWKLIDDIEHEFKLDLTIPDEWNRDDETILQMFSQILKEGKITPDWSTLAFTIKPVDSLDKIFDELAKGPQVIESNTTGSALKLFGQDIEIGDQIAFFPIAKVDSIEEFKESVEEVSNGHFRLRLKLYEGRKSLLIYPRFYGTNDRTEIIEKEKLVERYPELIK